MYLIETDLDTGCVTLSFDGIMTQDPEQFFQEFTQAAITVRRAQRNWKLLVDFSRTPVMEQFRAQNTAKIFDWCQSQGMDKAAIVFTMITQRMQMQRVTGKSDKIDYFESTAAAKKWLATA